MQASPGNGEVTLKVSAWSLEYSRLGDEYNNGFKCVGKTRQSGIANICSYFQRMKFVAMSQGAQILWKRSGRQGSLLFQKCACQSDRFTYEGARASGNLSLVGCNLNFIPLTVFKTMSGFLSSNISWIWIIVSFSRQNPLSCFWKSSAFQNKAYFHNLQNKSLKVKIILLGPQNIYILILGLS